MTMSDTIIRRKQNTASIRLPRQAENTRVAKPKVAKRTTTQSARRSAARSLHKGNEAVLAEPRIGVQGGVRPWERLLFVVVLAAIIVLSSVYVGSKVKARSLRFEMTEMKQEQLGLMKQQERLTQQVTTHKRPEQIEKRARQRGMVTPSSQQIITLP
jgi:cell division protein FtsL